MLYCNQCLLPIRDSFLSDHGLHFHPGRCWEAHCLERSEEEEAMQPADVQRKKHCDACQLTFGLAEKRFEFNGMVVHETPCLERLKRAEATAEVSLKTRYDLGLPDFSGRR